MDDLKRLDPRWVAVQREVGVYVALVLSIVLLASLLATFGPRRWYLSLAIWLFGAGLLAWRAYWWPLIDYRHRAYRVDEHGIEIHSGVVWREIANVPRSRVQHTDVAQGPLERKHGLGRLVIYTAGTAYSRVELPGLEHGTALAIRDHLLPRGDGDAV